MGEGAPVSCLGGLPSRPGDSGRPRRGWGTPASGEDGGWETLTSGEDRRPPAGDGWGRGGRTGCVCTVGVPEDREGGK